MPRKAAPKKRAKRPAKSKRDLPNLKRTAFLAAYAKSGNITAAAKSAKCHRDSHYEWLQDPDYERAFALAHAEACELLEVEARRRAVTGVNEPVIYQGRQSYEAARNKDGTVKLDPNTGEAIPVPLTIRKYSDVLLIFLMKAAMPHKYRDNFKGEVKDLAQSAARGADLLQNLTDEELSNLEQLARAAAERRRDRGGAGAAQPKPDPEVLPG